MKTDIRILFLLLIAALAIGLNACRKNNVSTDPGARLAFSQDTVFFDTVFATIGSTTKALRIYNNNNRPVVVSNVELEGGVNSPYRINLDGIPGDNFTDVEIAAGDSLWMFIEVTVDPGNINTPFIVEDRIRFTTNGNEQSVELVGWGQDAHFHGGPGALTVLDCNEVWNADKPHVVYGIVAVDEGCNLTINEGTQVYCHARSGIYVFKGTLDVNGAHMNEVVFQGDRLEPDFNDLPGQWGIELAFEFETEFGVEQATVARGGIWLMESSGSEIDWAIIKNGNIGVQVDTTGTSGDALQLRNTIIQNMGVIGLLGQGAHISGENTLIANCGQSCAAFTIGGRYQFAYSTFANYFTGGGNRQSPTFVLNNYYFDVNDVLQVRTLNNTWFHNCIIYGNNAALSDFNEFFVDIEQEQFQDYRFEFCAVDTDQDLSDPLRFNQMVNGVNPPFVAAEAADFHLSASTSTWNAGFVSPSFTPLQDLDALTRNLPGRKGCYETDGD